MTDKKLIVLLYAFRYAVDRIPTMALKDIEDELIDNLPKFPDWVLEQMQGDIERNFRMMQYKEAQGKLSIDFDCSFQEYLLEKIKERRQYLSIYQPGDDFMNRKLDGVYFRIKRDDKWQNICFSDLTEDEMDDVLKDRDPEWLKSMCVILGKTIKKIGDDLDIEMDNEE